MTRPLITDPDHPSLADYHGLTDVVLRTRVEPAGGLYIAESEKVIRRAWQAGHRPRSLLLSPRWVDAIADLISWCDDHDVPVYVGEPAVLHEVTGFNVHRGMLAAMHRPPLPSLSEVVQGARRLMVLENIVDHTNVGAAIRSCAALGFDGFLVTPRCADPLYRRSIRVSMGTVFALPWTRIEPWPEGITHLHDAGFTVIGCALHDNSMSLRTLAADPPDRLALVFGTEGDGLGGATLAACDLTVKIPMARGVDSLNVAAATAVMAWALGSQ